MSPTVSIADHPVLEAWLYQHDAKLLWENRGTTVAVVQGWRLNGHLVLVLLYVNTPGWGIFTAADTLARDATLLDVEHRVGLR